MPNPSWLVEMENQLTLKFDPFDYFEMLDLDLGFFKNLKLSSLGLQDKLNYHLNLQLTNQMWGLYLTIEFWTSKKLKILQWKNVKYIIKKSII